MRPHVGVPGAFFNSCPFCGALKLKPFSHPFPSPGENTLYSMCCSKGKVDIEEESPTPAAEYFVDLWSTDEIEGKLFRKYARKINNALSLASYLFTEAEMGGYNPNFKIKGTAYVAVGALLPGAVDVPKFSQIYIFDADDDNQRLNVRMDLLELGADIPVREKDVLRNICIEIEEKIRICNPYVK